ncbi:beta-1,4-N-acetylgalactosaminyltransferase bre-4-like [Adelges cooleyi]|uniref:beta-1,4-N-acetylgalactosaminyltransferase bre-4-like n=1 Tax=Adelges cooleyi TaxID=133065 RepID=UPI00217FAA4F|nr:beta-1,4-N-acetylgalactosaminyltransferase bre-4-like [Adelges cooleyi]XP_050428593.1 beta-1,4-N-acetylgalactosaminyltransferase bre-4-like [Adelges cooleyi]
MAVMKRQRVRVFRHTPSTRIWGWLVRVLPFLLVLLVVIAMCFIAITHIPTAMQKRSLSIKNSARVTKLKSDQVNNVPNNDFQLERLIKTKPESVSLFVARLKNEARGYCSKKLMELKKSIEKTKLLAETYESCRPKSWCPKIPPILYGAEQLSSAVINMTKEEIIDAVGAMNIGGSWAPEDCKARHSVCIIIPYRDRQDHLWTLLHRLIPVLKRQQLDFKIFVVEQVSNATFNKGAIMNAAFLTIYRTYGLRNIDDWHKGLYGCYIFHDVDMLPEDDRNMYSCSEFPKHLSVAVNEFKYQLPYHKLVGGVFNIRPHHYFQVNGYSNLFWGWGGEDDDMGYRLEQVGLPITRPPTHFGRYTMVKHIKRKPLAHAVRLKLVHTSQKRYKYDGLNTLKYEVFNVESEKLYTRILVDVGDMPDYVRSFEAKRTVLKKKWK